MQPTTVFNEGWLLRLALDWFAENPTVQHEIGVPDGTRWFSEAMLPTQFSKNAGDRTLSESYTRADGSIGHIKIGKNGEGDLTLLPGAQHFVVAEAKLNSKLSQGVTHASYYDQAARNVACMAKVLSDSATRPESLTRLAFVVVAPHAQILRGVYSSQLSKTSISSKVARRVREYESATQEKWLDEWFRPTLETISIAEISWESVTSVVQGADGLPEPWFEEFYQRCLEYNRLVRT